MGWLAWIVLSSLAFVSGYAVAVALFASEPHSQKRSSADRVVGALIVSFALIIIAIELVGFAGRLERVTLGIASFTLFIGVLVIAARHVTWPELRRIAAWDARAPLRLAASAWHEREVAAFTILVALGVFALVCTLVWFQRSHTFDCVWYHVTITDYVIQNRTLAWPQAHDAFTVGYPRNVELLAAWNCIFSMDNRLDDSPQIPFAILGALAVAAWCRSYGATRAFATSAGAAWFVLPPIYLVAATSYTDLVCGALFIAAAYFTSGAPTRASRWLTLLAMGLYIGAKYTGVFHLALLAPWLVWRVGEELVRSRKRIATLLDIAISGVGLASVSAYKYVQNYLHEGNPFYPIRTKVPFSSRTWPGPFDIYDPIFYSGSNRAESLYFFGQKGEFRKWVAHWLDPDPGYTPEVHDGGFGPLFRWILIPCILILVGDVLRRHRRREGVLLLYLFIIALAVPAAWWPRYTMAAPAAALVGLALIYNQIQPRILRVGVALALAGLSTYAVKRSVGGFLTLNLLPASIRASAEQRAAEKISNELWDTPNGMLREEELRPGDVVTYDESASFVSNYFSSDFRTHVVFVSSEGDAEDYVRRLRALNAYWVGVHQGTPAEAAVKGAGGHFLFNARGSQTAVYRLLPASAASAVEL